jgi:hypothetical protein
VSAPEVAGDWELEVRPRRSVRISIAVAIGLVVFFGVAGVLLRVSDTGVGFRRTDQLAMPIVGLVLAGGVLLLTRPRLRAGAQGVIVRNIMGDNTFAWKDVRGIAFPEGKSWARLELRDDEYVPVLAIRVGDKDHAVAAMERLRALGRQYA